MSDALESSKWLGPHRWKVQRTITWLEGFRALTIRYERKAAHFLVFVTFGAAMTCYKMPAKQADNPIPDVLSAVAVVPAGVPDDGGGFFEAGGVVVFEDPLAVGRFAKP